VPRRLVCPFIAQSAGGKATQPWSH